MTAIKAKVESRTILDFSIGEYSKNKIKQALSNCEITSCKDGAKLNEVVHYINKIKVGMYSIGISLPYDSPSNWNRLKQFDFEVYICEGDHPPRSSFGINLNNDGRFKDQYWVEKNFFGRLRIKHLTDIIAHCIRLNKLKAFL